MRNGCDGEVGTQRSARPFTIPLRLEEALGVATSRHRAGNLADAERAYLTILDADPDQPDALHFLGVLRHQTGESDRAVELIERAIHQAPTYADAYNNLGNIYKETGEVEKARDAYTKVIELVPDHIGALNNLGVVLKDLGYLDDAVETLQKALALAPESPDILLNLGNVYRLKKLFRDSLVYFRKALALKPYEAEAYRYLSIIHYLLNETAEAVNAVRQWLDFDPDNPVARHLLAAYTGENVPARASDDYVRATFDIFAPKYDAVLHGLDFQAPALVCDAVRARFGEPRGDLVVLDAGCGTGLCGELLRPFARTLIGVDLSSAMLAAARARSVYDDLVEAELTAFLGRQSGCFDLVIASDTLCYFGDLSPVFAAACAALAPGGCFVFTLENAGDAAGDEGVRLNAHGRYAHAEAYVRSALVAAGLDIDRADHAALRREMGDQVAGMVVTAVKAGNTNDRE